MVEEEELKNMKNEPRFEG